jgi:hypothetical protein
MTRRLPSLAAAFACLALCSACAERIAPPAGFTIALFDSTMVHFTPDSATMYDTALVTARDNGRVMTTRRELPGSIGPRRLTLHLQLRPVPTGDREVADRWDRAGSLRLVPAEGPAVELCRFMTSYGGATDHELDVTHLAPLLQGRCGFEVFIDTWVSPAWTVSAWIESEPMPEGVLHLPVWAAGAFAPIEGLTAAEPRVSAQLDVPEGVRFLTVAVTSTGHCTDGRDADEFESKDNVLLLDGQEVHRWRPWRDDCGELRHLNPYTAKWTDGWWSSDYDRSGWCPGDVAPPLLVDLGPVAPGRHTLEMTVENIRPAAPDDPDAHHGYWRVAAAVVGW